MFMNHEGAKVSTNMYRITPIVCKNLLYLISSSRNAEIGVDRISWYFGLMGAKDRS